MGSGIIDFHKLANGGRKKETEPPMPQEPPVVDRIETVGVESTVATEELFVNQVKLEPVEPGVVASMEPTVPIPAEPMIIKQTMVTVREKKDKVLSTIIDAKLEQLDLVKLEAGTMDLDKWSKVVARLHTERDVKVDANITAMGIFALFPVALQESSD